MIGILSAAKRQGQKDSAFVGDGYMLNWNGNVAIGLWVPVIIGRASR